MSIEAVSITILLVTVWIVLTMLDIAVAGILALAFGVAFRKAFLWGLLSLAVPVIAVTWGIVFGRESYQVKKVELQFENLPEDFDGYRLVQLSDIHSRSFVKRPASLLKAVNRVNGLDADLIVFTGDVITMSPDEMDVTGPILSDLKARDGVVSVLGNHDYGVYARPGKGQVKAPDCSREVARREQEMEWDILLDGSRIIRRGTDSIAVIGV